MPRSRATAVPRGAAGRALQNQAEFVGFPTMAASRRDPGLQNCGRLTDWTGSTARDGDAATHASPHEHLPLVRTLATGEPEVRVVVRVFRSVLMRLPMRAASGRCAAASSRPLLGRLRTDDCRAPRPGLRSVGEDLRGRADSHARDREHQRRHRRPHARRRPPSSSRPSARPGGERAGRPRTPRANQPRATRLGRLRPARHAPAARASRAASSSRCGTRCWCRRRLR